MTRLPLIACLAVGLLTGACSDSGSNAGDGGAGGDFSGPVTCLEPPDKSSNIDNAIDLKLGEEVTGYICPRGDSDFYKLTVPANDKLLRINLQRSGALSNVALTYLLLKRKEPGSDGVNQRTVASAPAGDGKSFDALHCLDPGTPDLEPGVYYLLVQDDGNDAADGKNSYKLTVTSQGDPDTNEVNDGFDTAKAASGAATGYISCTEDADFFTVNVGADQLLEVKLTTQAATPVDLNYTIYNDKQEMIATDAIPDGTKAKADLLAIHAVPGAGKYFVKVEDGGGDDGDPKTAYTLTLTTRAEQDAQDKGTRNDSAATATTLTFSGGTLTRTFTGQIASKADVDYFKIDGLSGININNPGVMEVTLSYGGAATVDPSFAYIYPAENSPCTKDSCCRVLDPGGSGCTSWMSCMNKTYSCIEKGETFCSDGDCAPNATVNCATERRCAGAAICLPSAKKCGAEQVIRWANDGGTAKTSQLLIHPGPWYVRVNDLKNDEYDYGKNYTLTIRVRMDPDGAKELDNAYLPDLCLLTTPPIDNDEVRKMHLDVAKGKFGAKTVSWNGGTTTQMTGFISYEGDIDWFRVPNPCPNADCILRLDYQAGSGCPTSGAPRRRCEDTSQNKDSLGLEFLYTLRRSNSSASGWFGFRAQAGQSGCWGDCGGGGNCFYSYKNHGSSDYYFTVEDYNNNSWSWTCGYTVTLTVTKAGCQAPCTTHPTSGNCDTP